MSLNIPKTRAFGNQEKALEIRYPNNEIGVKKKTRNAVRILIIQLPNI